MPGARTGFRAEPAPGPRAGWTGADDRVAALIAGAPDRGRRLAVVLTLAMLVLFGVGAASARAADITGTWDCCGDGGAAEQSFTITDSGGSLSGSAETGGDVFAAITGSVSGDDVEIVTTYNDFAPGYVATFDGTISADGLEMSGDWTSNADQSGTWTATSTGFELSGTVSSQDCTSTCPATPQGVPGITVEVASNDGGGISTSAVSDADGDWSVDVPSGGYTVTPEGDGWDPTSLNETVEGADVSGVDFVECSAPDTTDAQAWDGPLARTATAGVPAIVTGQDEQPAAKCKVLISGRISGSDGKPWENLDVAVAGGPAYGSPGYAGTVTNADGHFDLKVKRGPVTLDLFTTYGCNMTVATEQVDAKDKVNYVRDTVATHVIGRGSTRGGELNVCADGLPLSEPAFDVEVHREPPVNTGTCTDNASGVMFRSDGAFGRSGVVNLQPTVDDRFCRGHYTVTVTDKGKFGLELASDHFTLGR